MNQASYTTRYTYEIPPIDFGWGSLKTVKETLLEMFEDENQEDSLDIFALDWRESQLSARKKGWEGDFRCGPKVFWIPMNGDKMVYGFVFKQDNNGITFVVSPVPLPWLETER